MAPGFSDTGSQAIAQELRKYSSRARHRAPSQSLGTAFGEIPALCQETQGPGSGSAVAVRPRRTLSLAERSALVFKIGVNPVSLASRPLPCLGVRERAIFMAGVNHVRCREIQRKTQTQAHASETLPKSLVRWGTMGPPEY